MPIYRSLSSEELAVLEKEFVHFLVVQGIPADEWVRISTNDVEQTNMLVDNFSDMVFDSILSKDIYLEWRQKNIIRCFHAKESHLLEHAIIDDSEEANLADDNYCNNLLAHPTSDLKKYKRELSYQNRKLELFALTEQGAKISGREMFDFFASLD